MDIEEIKKLQSEGLKKQELNSKLKDTMKLYNSKCDEFGMRLSLCLSNIALQDVQEFLRNNNLTYSEPVDHRFLIDGSGIEIITADEGFTIKQKDVYKTFIVELLKDSQPNGFVYKCINVKGKLTSTSVEDYFYKATEQLNIDELQEVVETLNNALNDVDIALETLMNSKTFNYEYYEYKNEENRYKTIDDIIKNEI